MSEVRLITGLDVTQQMSKAKQILNNQVIPRNELFEIRKREGRLTSKNKKD